MKKKVIYISLLTTTLSGADWTQRDRLLETCGSVLWAPERLSWVRRRRIKCYTIVFQQKCSADCTVTKGDTVFEVQIEAKASFPSVGPHIRGGGRPPQQIIPFKKHRGKHFIQVAFIFSALERLRGIIHHDSASGQQPTFVNSFLSSLMHCVDIIDYRDKSHNYHLINIYMNV